MADDDPPRPPASGGSKPPARPKGKAPSAAKAKPPTAKGAGAAQAFGSYDTGESMMLPSKGAPKRRRGPTGRQKGLRALFTGLHFVVFVALAGAVLGSVGLGPASSREAQSAFMLLALVSLIGQGFLFQAIPWRQMRGDGQLLSARSDPKLLFVSFLSLLSAVLVLGIEAGALLVFLEVIPNTTPIVVVISQRFTPLLAAIMLVQVMSMVVRAMTPSAFRPKEAMLITSYVLSPVAVILGILAVLIGFDVHSRIGILGSVLPRQGIQLLAMGVGLEFLAMRVRLRLPPVVSLLRGILGESLKAVKQEQLNQKALWTYMGGFVFVAASMAFAGAVATGNLALGNRGTTLALTIFYASGAVVLLAVVAIRVLQSTLFKKADLHAEGAIEELKKRKRIDPETATRWALMALGGIVAAAALVVAIMTQLERMPWGKTYATDLGCLAIIAGAGPYGVFYLQDRRRIENMDKVFPDFLGDLAESSRTGLTLPRALVTSAQSDYGELTPEVKLMAAQVQWGVPFTEAFRRFSERVRTPLIDRSVNLIIEAQKAGGDVSQLLTTASEDARDIHNILHERQEQMKMYQLVVFIAFFVFIGVVLVLTTSFLPAFQQAVGKAEGQQVGGLNFKAFDPEDFRTIFFHASIVQAIGGGLIGGVLTRGQPIAGFPSTGFMLIAAWIAFRFFVSFDAPVDEAAEAAAMIRGLWP